MTHNTPHTESLNRFTTSVTWGTMCSTAVEMISALRLVDSDDVPNHLKNT